MNTCSARRVALPYINTVEGVILSRLAGTTLHFPDDVEIEGLDP